MSAKESAVAALFSAVRAAVLAVAPAAVILRDETIPQRLPPAGLVVVRFGDTVEETPILSPLSYAVEHEAEVEVVISGTTAAARAAAIDALLVAIGRVPVGGVGGPEPGARSEAPG